MRFSWKKSAPVEAPVAADLHPGNGIGSAVGKDYEYKVYSISETGPTRTSNEDSVCSSYPDGSYQCLFAMVADGMGGHNAGEVASSMACDILQKWVQQHYNDADPARMLSAGVLEAHKAIQGAAAQDASRNGMGTTATALYIRDRKVYYTHVGDSRLYQHSGGQWQQLTTDHTLVNELVMNGKLEADDAAGHPMKNYITQAVGYTKTITPEVSASGIPVNAGDCYLLVSDGVYDVLSGEELGAMINIKRPDLFLECVRTLCTERESSDNFSVLLVTVSDDLMPLPSVTKEQNAML